MNAMDLFSAGSETTATTLAWAVRAILFFAGILLSRLFLSCLVTPLQGRKNDAQGKAPDLCV